MNAGWCPLSSAYHQLQVEAGNKGADKLQTTFSSRLFWMDFLKFDEKNFADLFSF